MAAIQDVVLEKSGTEDVVRDRKAGRSFQLKGYGSMKGLIAFRSDLDLAKPIAEQVAGSESRVKKSNRKASRAVA